MFQTKKTLIFFLLIILIVIVAYYPAMHGFFQQDEWLAFNRLFILQEKGPGEFLANVFHPTIRHYTPLNLLVLYLAFSLFQLNFQGYIFLSLLLHLVTVCLVFYLAKLVFKKEKPALICALLFGILGSTCQATAWVMADIGTHGATIGGLICLIFFFLFLGNKKKSFFTLSLLGLIFSLLFKEITLALYPFLIFVFYLFGEEKLRRERKYPITLFLAGLFYLFLRGLMFFQPDLPDTPLETTNQNLGNLVYNLETFPIKSLIQTIIPGFQLLNLANFLGTALEKNHWLKVVKGTAEYSFFIEQEILEKINFVLFFLVLIFGLGVWLKVKEQKLKRIALFGLVFACLNSLIFAFSPERAGKIVILDSRNLYFLSVGVVFFLVSLGLILFAQKWKLGLILLSLVVFLNIFWLNQSLAVLVKEGQLRERILNQIKTEHPDLPEKVIFYAESDRSFYGLPEEERILPFQSGFGQTLIIWYYPEERFPVDFLKNKFLWEIGDQGYQEMGSRSFGYFRDFETLAEYLKTEDLSPDLVIGYRYDSGSQTLKEATPEIKAMLNGFFTSKRAIPSSQIVVQTLDNPDAVRLMLDGDSETAWDSKLKYKYPQYLLLTLRMEKRVAGMRIQSNTGQDQSKTGYQILFSGDGQEWSEVFNVKHYFPDHNGILDFYFQPETVKFIKINQIGYHEFSSWTINELTIFEVN